MENEENKVPILLEDLGMLFATNTSKKKSRFGLYECQFCKTPFKTITADVKSGHTKSCGCQKNKTTHGLHKNKFYKTWHGMMQRCFNKECAAYENYGARGITVYKDWHDVVVFITWAESTYIEGMTMDRKDNSKGYSPKNCRWVDKTTQVINRRILKNNKSGHIGVSLAKDSKKWLAGIKVNNKKLNLGYYHTALEAAKARDAYIVENGLPHRTNFDA